jgi:hypothetical protein
MTFVEFSDSDLLRNKLCDPAWYTLEIGEVGPWTPSKDQQSNNCLIEAVVIRNSDNGTEDFKGVPVTIQFNDKVKARGFIEGFLKSLGVDVQPGRYSLKAAQGEQVDAFIENETYEGRTRNRINHKYRPVRKPE